MPGRLYFKIFLSFIGVMVLAMFMVAVLFRFTEGQDFKERFKRFAQAQTGLVRTIIEERAERYPEYKEPDSDVMMDVLVPLSETYDGLMWITDESGRVLAQTFPGPLPTPEELAPEDPDDKDDYCDMGTYQYSRCDGPHCVYISLPYGGVRGIEPGVIHFLYRDPDDGGHEKKFLGGLLFICLTVALLIMPVSWIITRRLKQLRGCALRIAEGDLSHRADVCGKDEVAGVGMALNRMADSLSRMIRGSRELTANVSHELRTPLTRIRIAEEILRERCGEEGVNHLDSIREDVEALDKLIGKLLTLSKLDLKEDPFFFETVDVAELTRIVIDQVEPIAGHHNVTLTTDIPDEAIVEGDGEALLTGLGNILENGVKHATNQGWLKVAMTQGPSNVRIVAENSHEPLPVDELEAIFEPFRRAKGTTNKGFGLGLAIARKIFERHGGSVRAENCAECVRFIMVIPKKNPACNEDC